MFQSDNTKSIVLYADDDCDDLELVKDAFARYSSNVELVTFSNGVEALTFLKRLTPVDPIPCLIILDINMPLLDGKEVLSQLRGLKRFDAVPVILFSTSSQNSDKEFAHVNGAGFITKPLSAYQMQAIIEQFIKHCSTEVQDKIRKQVG